MIVVDVKLDGSYKSKIKMGEVISTNVATGSLLTRQARSRGEGTEPELKRVKLIDDKKIQHMMENMGYQQGKGLGVNGDGIVSPLEPVYRSGTTGLGYDSTNKRTLEDKVEPVTKRNRID